MIINNYTLGIIFIILVAIIWAGASVLVQYIFVNLDFNEPFFLTYMSTSLFMLYLPSFKIGTIYKLVENVPFNNDDSLPIPNEKAVLLLNSDNSQYDDDINNNDNNINKNENKIKLFSHKQIMKIALIMCPLWFLANCAYNYSLSMTSVTSGTIISTTSSLFTLILSVLYKLEKFTILKLFGVLLCISGSIMVALNDKNYNDDDTDDDDDDIKPSFWGDVVALFAAFMYGVYTTALKKMVPSDDMISFQLLFGYLGIFNFLIIGPIVLILFLSNLIHLENLTGEIFGFLLLKGLFDNVLSDYCWARGVCLTSPSIATVGLSLTIPLAFITDYLLHSEAPTALSLSGGFLVIIGFISVNWNH